MSTETRAPLVARVAAPIRHALNGDIMGTRWSAVFYAPPELPTAGLGARLQAAVAQVDAQMSTWKPDSDLMRFNRAPVGIWVSVPRPLCEVMAAALAIGADSGGAFDIGVGAAVNAWGFGSVAGDPVGAPAAAGWANGAVDVDLDMNLLRRRRDVSLDLSGIAKGYGVDALAEVLAAQEIADFLVAIDGEMRASGFKPDGSGWSVGIERPLRHRRELAHVVSLSDMAIATSGDYRHWREHGSEVVAHTIDPATGAPLRNQVASVTVSAAECAVADAWATALLVLGETAGAQRARELELDALFIIRHDDGSFGEVATGVFAEIL